MTKGLQRVEPGRPPCGYRAGKCGDRKENRNDSKEDCRIVGLDTVEQRSDELHNSGAAGETGD